VSAAGTGLNYLTNFVLPNFFFFVTMAYTVLRKNSVELGKRDFLGPYPMTTRAQDIER
jgi:hypothetical protein